MKHEIFDTVLNVSDTDVTFEGIYQKPYVPAEYIDDIKKANLLIIPNEGFRDESDVLFPETTREFFDFIKELWLFMAKERNLVCRETCRICNHHFIPEQV